MKYKLILTERKITIEKKAICLSKSSLVITLQFKGGYFSVTVIVVGNITGNLISNLQRGC